MTREERREEQRKFEADVYYEVWRSGKNPDAINLDRLNDCFYEGHDAQVCARRIIHEQQARHSSIKNDEQEQGEQEQFNEDLP